MDARNLLSFSRLRQLMILLTFVHVELAEAARISSVYKTLNFTAIGMTIKVSVYDYLDYCTALGCP